MTRAYRQWTESLNVYILGGVERPNHHKECIKYRSQQDSSQVEVSQQIVGDRILDREMASWRRQKKLTPSRPPPEKHTTRVSFLSPASRHCFLSLRLCHCCLYPHTTSGTLQTRCNFRTSSRGFAIVWLPVWRGGRLDSGPVRLFPHSRQTQPPALHPRLGTAVMTIPNWSHAKARLLFGTGFRKILVVVKHSAYEVRE